ncbi:ABC transporter substrate-binding protein [Fodinicola acaciae]|uniref:ABC transporter substrate-binding protein n=1 Tax=Fodinicola acaciae TaxID=2681555 RepID=UPI0013D290A4|nr:sugar ABC transporter substrate-binding protein [Fodinicola acaciae]
MRKKALAFLSAALLAASGLAACSSGGSGSDANTITYWASNQAPSLQKDKEILTPRLAAFTKQTGIKVNLEVIAWDHLLDRITTATTSGDGPDVVNIGNTWSASLQATGAFVDFDSATFKKVGGKEKFLATSLSSTGAAGKAPTSVPLYGLSYGLFYNKKKFADAGIANPPTSWTEFVADAKKLTNPAKGEYGVSFAGASYTENVHFAYILGQQYGSDYFDASGKATFATPQNVKGVKRYLDWLGADKISIPSSAEHGQGQDAVADFTSGKAAMIMQQTGTTASIAAGGMKESDYGVVPLPIENPLPPGGRKITSFVAGINISAFKEKNTEAALKFINYMTSPAVQVDLNKQFGSLPVVGAATSDPAFQTPTKKVFVDVLRNSSKTMPMVVNESQFETTVGAALKDLVAQQATGKIASEADVKAALTAAQQKLTSGG